MSRAAWNNVILSVRWERILSVDERSHVRWTAQNALHFIVAKIVINAHVYWANGVVDQTLNKSMNIARILS